MSTVNTKPLADGSTGLEGYDKNTGDFIFLDMQYTTTSALTTSGPVVNRQMVVHNITFCPDAASTNAVTMQVYAAPSGTALGSGTALLSAPMAINGTAATNVVGALSTVAGALVVPAGSRVGFVISGAIGAAGAGTVTICANPA